MLSPFLAGLSAAATLGWMVADGVHAQNYPDRPVRMVLGLAPGGGTDVMTRIVAARLTEVWRQQVVVENRLGAGATISADIVAKANPDGNTLLVCTIGTHAIAPALYKKLPYDHIRDFAPVSLIGTTPNVMVVHPSVPAKSVKEFIAHAKANPGKLQYGSSGVGTTLHLSMEMLKSMTGIDVVHVPYKGGAPALADLLGGHVHVMVDNLPGQLPMIKAARIRPLAVTTPRRSALLPELPTMVEAGVPGFEVTVWYAVCAPAAVPKQILVKLNTDLVNVLKMPDLRQRLVENGVDPSPSTPEQLAALIKSETVKWAKVVKDSGASEN